MREQEGLTALGRKTEYRQDYAPEVLETFLNKHPDNDYWVRFNCPEFTSLCPITGQPDFAEIRISYIPAERMVESKSLKLYLFSFRNHGDFHEDCVNIIMKDLIRLMQPKYIEVTGIFTPRGGISIWPYANYGMPGTRGDGGLQDDASRYALEASYWQIIFCRLRYRGLHFILDRDDKENSMWLDAGADLCNISHGCSQGERPASHVECTEGRIAGPL